MFRKLYLVTGVLAGLAAPAAAQDAALFEFKSMTLETATTLAQKAMADCRGRGYQVAVAVVDRAGILQVLIRDRFAGPHTPETARRKAWTAVSFRSDTKALAALTEKGPASGIRFVGDALTVGGGVPVQAAGSMVGGVGVSGGPSGAEDDACARKAIEAIQADLDF